MNKFLLSITFLFIFNLNATILFIDIQKYLTTTQGINLQKNLNKIQKRIEKNNERYQKESNNRRIIRYIGGQLGKRQTKLHQLQNLLLEKFKLTAINISKQKNAEALIESHNTLFLNQKLKLDITDQVVKEFNKNNV